MIPIQEVKMKGYSMVILLAMGLGMVTAGCSGDDDTRCIDFCKSIEQKVVDQMPDVPEGFCTSDAGFAKAVSCEDCKAVLFDSYKVSLTDDPNQDCMGFF
jgi:hypothetical protein